MGNASPKHKVDHLNTLAQEDADSLRRTFMIINQGGGDRCKQSDFEEFFKNRIDEHLLLILNNYYFENGKRRTMHAELFEKLFCTIAKGDHYERAEATKDLITNGVEVAPMSVMDIKQYLKSLLATYMKMQVIMQDKEFNSWTAAECSQSAEVNAVFVESLCDGLSNANLSEQFTSWYISNPQVDKIQKDVFHYAFDVPQSVFNLEGELVTESSFPHCTGVDVPGFHSLLDMAHILYLNHVLPAELRCEWRFLFSTAVHGESFSKLLGHISDKGPSVIVIKDKSGHIFGGFATDSWSLGPNFQGTSNSFLFTLYPYMRVFESTGYNDHYQYLNINQQTMPNGLGMGGQFEYFGLWLDADFGIGHSSESCTTYKKYQMLSAQKEFQISDVEVWGVGPKPVKDEIDEERGPSILDKDMEARAMLEIAGKSMKSDGYRDKD